MTEEEIMKTAIRMMVCLAMATTSVPVFAAVPRALRNLNHHLMVWVCVGILATVTGVAARVFRRGVPAPSFTEFLSDESNTIRSYSAKLHEAVAAAASCSDELRTLDREFPARATRAALMQEGMLTPQMAPGAASLALERLLVARRVALDGLEAEMARRVTAGQDAVPTAAVLTGQAHGLMLHVCIARDVARAASATLRH
jgi:hypothetical protein